MQGNWKRTKEQALKQTASPVRVFASEDTSLALVS